MAILDVEVAAFKAMAHELEAAHFGEWAVIRGAKLEGLYPSFDAAAADAVSRFGRGPYLIRQIGAPPLAIPAAVAARARHAAR